jgi:hypothetical protein
MFKLIVYADRDLLEHAIENNPDGSFRSAAHWKGEVEPCEACVVYGHPEIRKAYKEAGVKVSAGKKPPKKAAPKPEPEPEAPAPEAEE